MVETAAIVRLLIAKGIITEDEWMKTLADVMEEEAESYRQRLSDRLGRRVELE